MTGLDTALTPLRFLRRAADVYPYKTAIVDGPRRFSYTDAAESATSLARAIAASGVDLQVIPTNPDTRELEDVPSDGVTVGEIVMRGNTVMKGYPLRRWPTSR